MDTLRAEQTHKLMEQSPPPKPRETQPECPQPRALRPENQWLQEADTATSLPEPEPENSPRDLSYSEIKAKKMALAQHKARIEAQQARLSEQMRKAETRFKITVGGWILACAKAAKDGGKFEDFEKSIENLKSLAKLSKNAKLSENAAAWLEDQIADIKAAPPKRTRKPKEPQE